MATAIGRLDPFFSSLITDLMAIERQPLTRLQSQRDTINVRRGAYSDLQSQLDALQTVVKSLNSAETSYAFTAGRTATVSDVPTGTSVLTATASSSAIAGTYDIAVTTLAQEHRVRSDQQTYTDQALNLSGTVIIGGAAARSQTTTATIANTVTGFGVAAPESGKTEIGTGTHYVETRNDATNGWQFRVVDAGGKAESIKLSDGSGSYSSDWQAIPTGGGSYDTGLGLTITFGTDSGQYQAGDRSSGNAAQVSYTAQGASITVSTTDSLNAVATAINSATYAEGNTVVATVVDRQLVLAAEDTGTAHAVVASDSSGTVLQSLGVLTGAGAFKNVMQSAADASFTVNGLTVTRSKNTGLDDVITGVTLNLAADAAGNSATLTVSKNFSAARSMIDDFISKFNSVQTYLQTKTSVTAATEGDNPTYTRGTLANDTIFSNLRDDLFSRFMSDVTNSGIYDNLREIGLTIDDNLQASVSDSDALDAALGSNFDDVTALFDQFTSDVDTLLDRFTGSSGYLDSTIDSFDAQVSDINSDIDDLNVRLDNREESLIGQFAAMQVQLLNLTYMQKQWAGIYNSFSGLF